MSKTTTSRYDVAEHLRTDASNNAIFSSLLSSIFIISFFCSPPYSSPLLKRRMIATRTGLTYLIKKCQAG